MLIILRLMTKRASGHLHHRNLIERKAENKLTPDIYSKSQKEMKKEEESRTRERRWCEFRERRYHTVASIIQPQKEGWGVREDELFVFALGRPKTGSSCRRGDRLSSLFGTADEDSVIKWYALLYKISNSFYLTDILFTVGKTVYSCQKSGSSSS